MAIGGMPQVLGQPQQPVADPVLDVEPVVHQLEEVVVPAEDVLEVGGRLPRLVVVADAAARSAPRPTGSRWCR